MADTVTVTVRGLREVGEALRKLGPELAEQVGDQALRAMARPILDDARARAPKDRGVYAASLAVAVDRKFSKDGARTGRIGQKGGKGGGSRLAHLLEFGTSRMAARPHLRPALDGQAAAAIRAGADALARGLARVVRRLATGKKVRGVR